VHQTEITLEELGDLLVDFELRDTCELGDAQTITGRHPDLGPVLAIRDGANVTLLTHRPLSFNRIPDTYSLEIAIAQIAQARLSLTVGYSPKHGGELSADLRRDEPDEMSGLVEGMLTWLGIDPLTAKAREIAYAREAVAHAHKMANLPAAKLAELRAQLVSDLEKLAA
jgi:hypothetical protein